MELSTPRSSSCSRLGVASARSVGGETLVSMRVIAGRLRADLEGVGDQPGASRRAGGPSGPGGQVRRADLIGYLTPTAGPRRRKNRQNWAVDGGGVRRCDGRGMVRAGP